MDTVKGYRRISVICTSIGLMLSLCSSTYAMYIGTCLFIVALWLELYVEENDEDPVEVKVPIIRATKNRGKNTSRA
ncbi:MAG: hypothetical protein PHY47_00610 [Lachnospiraceae bacterium]|nr:hypothetical protein [Lachnospiraceae bacterium]